MFILIRVFNLQLDFLGETHMLFKKSKKFHNILNFEENGLTLNHTILSKETPKFEACMNTYFYLIFN